MKELKMKDLIQAHLMQNEQVAWKWVQNQMPALIQDRNWLKLNHICKNFYEYSDIYDTASHLLNDTVPRMHIYVLHRYGKSFMETLSQSDALISLPETADHFAMFILP